MNMNDLKAFLADALIQINYFFGLRSCAKGLHANFLAVFCDFGFIMLGANGVRVYDCWVADERFGD